MWRASRTQATSSGNILGLKKSCKTQITKISGLRPTGGKRRRLLRMTSRVSRQMITFVESVGQSEFLGCIIAANVSDVSTKWTTTVHGPITV